MHERFVANISAEKNLRREYRKFKKGKMPELDEEE